MGWQIDQSKAQVRRLEPAQGNRWRVSGGGISLILNENPMYVRIGHSTSLRRQRQQTTPNPSVPFRNGENNWYIHAKGIVGRFLPGLTFAKTGFKEIFLQSGPNPMLRTNANSALIELRVSAPESSAGDQITLIMDRATGKPLSFSYVKKRV
jgi:hypothetical protein